LTKKQAESLGRELRRLRLLADIPLRRFAALVDVSAPYVSDIEHGRRRPSEEVLRRMAKALKSAGATFERLDRLNSRIDPDLQEWISETPAVRHMLRQVMESGENPLDVIRRLEQDAEGREKFGGKKE